MSNLKFTADYVVEPPHTDKWILLATGVIEGTIYRYAEVSTDHCVTDEFKEAAELAFDRRRAKLAANANV